MNRLLQQVRDRDSITPLMLDYTDKQAFSSALKQTIQRNGAVQLITAWVHLEGAPAFNSILPYPVQGQPWRLMHILGSKRNADKVKETMPIPDGCRYCQIQLGHLEEQGGKRWLTHNEISGGVIRAIQSGQVYYQVGVAGPAEM